MQLVFSVGGIPFRVSLKEDLRVIAGTFSGSSFPVGFSERMIGDQAFLVRSIQYLQGKEVFLLFARSLSAASLFLEQLSEAPGIELRPDLAFGISEVRMTRNTLNGAAAAIPYGVGFHEYCRLRFSDFVDVHSEGWQSFIRQEVAACQDPAPVVHARGQLALFPTPAIVVESRPEAGIPIPRSSSLDLQAPRGPMSYEELASRFPLLVQPDAWPFTFQVMIEAGENFGYYLALCCYLQNSVGSEQLRQILNYWSAQGRLCLFLDNYQRTFGF